MYDIMVKAVQKRLLRYFEEVFLEKDRFELFNQMTVGALKSIQRIKGKHMEKYGLASTHTICLRMLYDNPDGLTKKEISDSCDIDKSQISRIVTELINKGYANSDNTGRTYNHRFFLTDMGRKITEEINSIVLEVNKFVSGAISDEDIDKFYNVFEAINEGLRNAEKIF